MPPPEERLASRRTVTAARRVVFGFGLREIGLGALALAVLGAAGLWLNRRATHHDAELRQVRAELAMRADAADVYRERFAAIQADAARVRAWADAQSAEPLRTWARERSRRMDALVAALDQDVAARTLAKGAKEVTALCARGDLAAAQVRLSELPAPVFPPASELARLRGQLFEPPLAEFSRQNPEFYRAFRQFEPDAARQDEQLLRAEIAGGNPDAITPQRMLKLDLLAAVAAPDDPVIAEWSALASALDYFESPDAATLARWRRAQHAVRAQDWPAAAAEMQAILKSTVRTRQPFRAALGRALLKSRPDQPGEAYPYLAEAAASGDKQARAWVARQDYDAQRFAQAQRWVEAQVADGESEAVPLLLALYRQPALVADAAHCAGVLERVTDRPDAPADAWLLLGRLYERGDPPGSSPAKAFACYVQAGAKGSAAGNLEVARCALRGTGTAQNLEQARDAACRAMSGGERENAAALLLELMQQAPALTAPAVQQQFGEQSIAGGGGYMETRVVDGPGVMQLKAALARYLEQIGLLGQAARVYGSLRDPAAVQRHAELTAAHPCDTCGGLGKVLVSTPCPSCGGKGRQICSFCGGTGTIYVPGVPPCTACAGSGTMIQDRKVVTCSVCGGTGKGKGSVVKQDCTHCEHGYIRCPECVAGVLKITKECPDCHGRGTWSLAERSK